MRITSISLPFGAGWQKLAIGYWNHSSRGHFSAMSRSWPKLWNDMLPIFKQFLGASFNCKREATSMTSFGMLQQKDIDLFATHTWELHPVFSIWADGKINYTSCWVLEPWEAHFLYHVKELAEKWWKDLLISTSKNPGFVSLNWKRLATSLTSFGSVVQQKDIDLFATHAREILTDLFHLNRLTKTSYLGTGTTMLISLSCEKSWPRNDGVTRGWPLVWHPHISSSTERWLSCMHHLLQKL